MTLDDFRESYINDINAEAINTSNYPIEVFIDNAIDILKNDYSLITDMSHCFYEWTKGTKAHRNMRVDAAYLDLPSNTLNLLFAEYNDGTIKTITNTFIETKSQLLVNYFENCLKGFFNNAEQADPPVQLARDIRLNVSYIYKIHLFIISTDKLSKAVKTLELPEYTYNGQTFKVELDVLDIDAIYKSKLAGFAKEDIVINCSDFGIEGIPCIKADIETEQYESYLAIVPGTFLAEIYKKHSAALLEANVRSFLKFNGGVNKGIRGTILNEKSRFFTYNNGISTTAKSITTALHPEKGLLITSFTDLQIINGGQTTATLAATNIKYNADLSGIFVQMKLTILKDSDPELIRNIATYANSQNKVKTADLNSSHPFYVRMEDFSRRIYAPFLSLRITANFLNQVRAGKSTLQKIPIAPIVGVALPILKFPPLLHSVKHLLRHTQVIKVKRLLQGLVQLRGILVQTQVASRLLKPEQRNLRMVQCLQAVHLNWLRLVRFLL